MTREVDQLIAFNLAGNTGCYAGYTTNGKHTDGSYHERLGTPSPSGPIGLAVDFDAYNNAAKLMACARWFDTHRSQLFELIYSPLGYSVKQGQKVAAYDVAGGYDHVHVAVALGTLLVPPVAPSPVLPAVYGPIAQHGDTMRSQQFTTAPLGADGNGWIDTRIPFEKFVSLVPLGPAPQRDGYGWANWTWFANDTNGTAEIEIEGGEANKLVGFVAWFVD